MTTQFQSLSGFPLSCDRDRLEILSDPARVSIPIGFSIELRRRDSGGVRGAREGFQSLSGFPLSCDLTQTYPSPTIPTRVSIPIGFSIELRPHTWSAPAMIATGFNPYRVFH